MRINRLIAAISVLMLSLGILITPVAQVSAVNVISDSCKIDSSSAICKGKDETIQPLLQTVIDTLLFAIGVIAVIMIIIGGFRYTLSGGESKSITDAKNTILYAAIGLAVAFSAYAIVHWVLKLFG